MSNVDLKKLLSKILQQTTPVGQPTPIGKIDMYAGSTAPSGWLFCRGQAISRTTYAKLFSVIGTTYGGGDGSTTFNVPDLRNRMPIGAGDTYALNASGGNKDAIVPYHNHSVNKVTSGGPSNNTSGTPSNNTSGTPSNNTSGGMSANADHSHTYDKASGQGWNQNHASGTFISYTTNTWPSLLHNSTNTGSKNLAHTHSLQNHTHSLQNHTHSLSSHTHEVGAHNTNYAGSDGNATNANLPPYRGINFMIYCG